jgi:hypothetical protein
MIKLLLISLLFFNSTIGSEWQLRKNDSGIEIYTRRFNGSSFEEFRGVTIINSCSLPDVLTILLDVKNYDRLYPDCVYPKTFKQYGKFYDIHYIQTKGPFMVKDRDCVYEQKTEIDKNGKHARVSLKPLPDYIAENEDMVRIRRGSGFWELEENNNNYVKVIFQFHGDPGGQIPSWIANVFVASFPFNTLNNLRIRLNK